MKQRRWIYTACGVLVPLLAVLIVTTAIRAQDVSVTPSAGPSGTLFTFVATGFANGERAGVWINAPADQVIPLYDTDGNELMPRANDAGEVTWTAALPPDAAPGFYAGVAQGTRSGTVRVVPFELTGSASSPSPATDASVSPAAGPAGTQFVFVARGFERNEQIGVWANAPDGTVIEIRDQFGRALSLFANVDGEARWVYMPPADFAPGPYTMVAQGTASNTQHIISFTIE
jgi:hypothetical protein